MPKALGVFGGDGAGMEYPRRSKGWKEWRACRTSPAPPMA